jgi:two-component system sensor histidine kinase/response regulator
LKDSLIILSNWAEEIQQSLVKTNAFCIAIFTLDGKLLFSNEAFLLLTKNNPIESFVNPKFDELCKLTKEINPIFVGVLTLGDYYSINTSIEAKVYYKHGQLLITGGVDVSQLLEYNMMMHRLNRDNTNMQRELIKKTRTIEQVVSELKTSNDELEKMNCEYAAVNEQLMHSNAEVVTLNQQLTKKNEQMMELIATKDKFSSIIAHDLRNPFNSLLGFSELLKKNAANYSTDEITEFANEMMESSKQAYNLVENLLEWSRIQTGTITPQAGWTPATDIIGEVKNLAWKQAQMKQINLTTEIDSNISIYADKEMTTMILRNLVSNAIKFTPLNGTVTIKVTQCDTATHIVIIDNGMGIEPEHLSNLFRIDRKLSKAGTAGESGTGLGLLLCREFVEIQGGEIWASSSPGVGSEFHFKLPLPIKKTKKSGKDN